MREKNKYYKRWNRSGRPNNHKKFSDLKHLVRRLTDRAYEKYLGDNLGVSVDTNDLDTDSSPKVNNMKL